MLSKQLSSLLLAVALPQLGRALPLDAGVDRLAEQPPTSCEPRNVTCGTSLFGKMYGYCQGPIYICSLHGLEGYLAVPLGGCVQCRPEYWIPWREWTDEEIMDYILRNKIPPP
jgi:hypothetical protein